MTDQNIPQPNPGHYEHQFDNDTIDFKRYLSLFFSNWYWFAISIFVSLTIAYGINRYSEKLFTVSSTMLIQDDQNGGGLSYGENFIPGSDVFKSEQNLNNEIGILKSFNLNRRVIDSLPEFRIIYFGVGRRNIVESRLYKNCPFQVIARFPDNQPKYARVEIRITSDSTIMIENIGGNPVNKELSFGQEYVENGFNFILRLRDAWNYDFDKGNSNKYYFYFAGSEDLANTYRSKLSVTPIDQKATLVTLSTTGYVREQEVDYLNKLMHVYLNLGLEAKNQIADSTLKFIDRQLGIISDSLHDAEMNLQNFRLENKLIDLSSEGSFIKSRLEQFEQEKSSFELQKQYYQYLEEYLTSKNESGDIISPYIMGIADQTLGRLVQELALLQKNKTQLSMNLEDDLPAIDLSENNIIKAKKTLLENVHSSFINVENSLIDVNRRIGEVNNEISRLPGTERRMINIQRKFDINNTVYTYLLEKRAETGIARASTVSDNRIIDEAEIFNSAQIRPRARTNYLKALVLGLLIPAILLNLLYYFNNKIIDNSDITSRTNVPIIGYVSHNDDKKELPIILRPDSALAESLRAIRTSLRFLIKDTPNPVIAVTSTISSEGKTFISINLAAVTALLGKKVLLIGLDMRKPRIHKVLGVDNQEGMSKYLSSNCEYGEVIKETSVKNLYYASSGPVPPNPAELIDDIRMDEFMEKAKKEFDFIFIDTPPIAVVTDTLMLARFVDINLFIVRQRYSSKNTLELIQELYRMGKLRNMGIIINDISLSGYYGYGLRYGYYKGYGYNFGKNYYGEYTYGRYGYSDKERSYFKT